nr:MAG TPA: hypothetical protein [Caudoviricetes sp.]
MIVDKACWEQRMNSANHRAQVSDLLDEWTNNPKQARNIINCLVEFLTGDLYWLNENISRVDRQTLVAAAKRLEHSEAPNAGVTGAELAKRPR